MEQITYLFKTGMMNRTISSKGDCLITETLGFGNKDLVVNFEEITLVEIKKVGMTGGANIKLLIHYEKDGKKNIFPDGLGIEAIRSDQYMVALINELIQKAPQADIVDKTQSKAKKPTENGNSFNIVPSFLGSITSLPNWFSLGLFTLCFSPLLFTIPIGIYAITKGYRVLIDESGLILKKLKGKSIQWSEVKGVQLKNVKLRTTSNLDLGDLIEYEIILKDDQTVSFFTRFDEAKSLEEIFRGKGLMQGNHQQVFAV